jgi:hypothetical protein
MISHIWKLADKTIEEEIGDVPREYGVFEIIFIIADSRTSAAVLKLWSPRIIPADAS